MASPLLVSLLEPWIVQNLHKQFEADGHALRVDRRTNNASPDAFHITWRLRGLHRLNKVSSCIEMRNYTIIWIQLLSLTRMTHQGYSALHCSSEAVV
eukprot:2798120-Amphidinium_carterae.1